MSSKDTMCKHTEAVARWPWSCMRYFKFYIVLYTNCYILIIISLNFVLISLMNCDPAIAQIMSWCQKSRQTITWQNGGIIYRCMYTSLGLDELAVPKLDTRLRLTYYALWVLDQYHLVIINWIIMVCFSLEAKYNLGLTICRVLSENEKTIHLCKIQ